MLRASILFLAVGIALSFQTTATANPLPTKDGGAPFGNHHGLGFSDGTLYLHTGDSIYTVDTANPSDPEFTLLLGGIRSAFAGPQRVFEGAFAAADGGHALVSMGFTDGGVLHVDLAAPSATPIADFDTDNIFSAAARRDLPFYATWVDPAFATSTFVYHVDTASQAPEEVVDPAAGTGEASGGMAFDTAGNLVVGSFDFINGRARFYQILATDLLAFEMQGTTPPTTLLGESPANGNANVVAAMNGDIYFNTTTGIGRFNPTDSGVNNIYRDILDPDLFNYDPFRQPLNGLAYDEATQQLVFAEFNPFLEVYELVFLQVPEPAALPVIVGGALAFLRQRPTPQRARR